MADDEAREARKRAQALKLMEEEQAKRMKSRAAKDEPGMAKAARVAADNLIYLESEAMSEPDTAFETPLGTLHFHSLPASHPFQHWHKQFTHNSFLRRTFRKSLW